MYWFKNELKHLHSQKNHLWQINNGLHENYIINLLLYMNIRLNKHRYFRKDWICLYFQNCKLGIRISGMITTRSGLYVECVINIQFLANVFGFWKEFLTSRFLEWYFIVAIMANFILVGTDCALGQPPGVVDQWYILK